MAIKAGSFFGNVKGGFKLGKSKPKLQGRFIRKKVNTNKNVKFAKKETKPIYNNNSFMYEFLTSFRDKINAPFKKKDK